MDLSTYQEFARQYAGLKSSNWRAAGWTLRVVILTAVAFALSFSTDWPLWLAGQALLALAIMQWFFLLHDCGHRHFFATPWLNTAVGHIASIFCIVPYSPWRSIHAQHHLWTGWKDLDPTQKGVKQGPLPLPLRLLVDVCWALWIPLFTAFFGIMNFWNLPRCIQRFSRNRSEAWHHAASMAFVLAGHGLMWGVIWPGQYFHLFALGQLGFFVLSDPLLLSQHAHMPGRRADGEEVLANKVWDQDEYTRSIVFPRWASRNLLFHFDVHIVHHLLPNVPGYHLGQVHDEVETVNTINWWRWLWQAKRTPAHILLFQTRTDTGLTL